MARRKSIVATSGPPSVCTNCKATYRNSSVVGLAAVTRGGAIQRLCPRCAKETKAAKARKKRQRQTDTNPGPDPGTS